MAIIVALSLIVVLVNAFIARGQSSGVACSSVLEAGLFNRISASPWANYLEIKFALCLPYSGYTYNQYQEERATLDASKGASGANAYCTSQAFHFDVAANGLYKKGSASGGDKISSYSECTSNSVITFNSYPQLSEKMFDQLMAHIKVYQELSCATSGHVKDSGSDSVAALSEFVEPQVYQAYISCLSLLSSGIRFTQISSHDSRSLSIDLTYTPPPGNKDNKTPALLNGFQQTGSATCTLQGPGLSPSSSTLRAKLSPNTPYSIFCTLPPSTPKDGGFTDLFFHASPGGTFHALLFHGTPPEDESPIPTSRRSLVTVSNLANTVSKLKKKVDDLTKTVKQNKAAFDAIYNTKTGVLNVSTIIATDVSTTILYIDVEHGGPRPNKIWVLESCGLQVGYYPLCLYYVPSGHPNIPEIAANPVSFFFDVRTLPNDPTGGYIDLSRIARKVYSLP